ALRWIRGGGWGVIRRSRTSGVRPTASAIEGSAFACRPQSRLMPRSTRQPVAQRLDDRARLDESLADRCHDLLRAGAVAVDADGLDLHVDHLARAGPDLAVHDHADGLIGGLRGIGDERVL